MKTAHVSKTTFTISHVWKPHEMITKLFLLQKLMTLYKLLVPSHAVSPTLAFISASCAPGGLADDCMGRWTQVHTVNMQQRTIHEFALLQLPGSAEMSKTCYSPFGNMLWLLINANSLLSTVIHNYFSVTKWLTTISTSSSGAKSIP